MFISPPHAAIKERSQSRDRLPAPVVEPELRANPWHFLPHAPSSPPKSTASPPCRVRRSARALALTVIQRGEAAKSWGSSVQGFTGFSSQIVFTPSWNRLLFLAARVMGFTDASTLHPFDNGFHYVIADGNRLVQSSAST